MGSNSTLPLATFQPLDLDNFADESHVVVDFIDDYYRNIDKYPVRSQVEPGYLSKLLPDQPPLFPEPLDAILDDIRNDVLPGLTHWQSPNFFAYFQTTASTAGFLGEMLCSGLNVVAFSWIASPAATELECLVMDWMAKMLKLPPAFLFSTGQGGGGILHGTTSESVLCTMFTARDRALSKIGYEGINKLVVYVSDQTHSTVQKVSKIIGIPPTNFRVIPTTAASSYGLTADSVREAIIADVARGLVPLYLCATIGTTGVGAVDPLLELGQVAQEFGAWFHVDSAYAGSAVICPEFRHYFDGIELADSVSVNTHKWLLTNMDCCCLWVKNSDALVNSLSTDPEYLRNNATDSKLVVDFKDWQLALGHRFRALKLWLVIRRYGIFNLVEHIRSDVAMAKQFEKLVKSDKRFEVVVTRRFALVCFRLRQKSDGDDAFDINRKLLEAVNASGRAFLTHGVVGGMFMLRFAIGGTLTEMRHVEAAWKLIQDKADEISVEIN